MTRAIIVVCLVLSGLLTMGLCRAAAQTGPTPPAKVEATAPVLTTEQAQAVRIAMQDITIARLQLDKANADFSALMQSLQRAGYVIAQGQDGKLVYQPEPKTAAPMPAPEPSKK